MIEWIWTQSFIKPKCFGLVLLWLGLGVLSGLVRAADYEVRDFEGPTLCGRVLSSFGQYVVGVNALTPLSVAEWEGIRKIQEGAPLSDVKGIVPIKVKEDRSLVGLGPKGQTGVWEYIFGMNNSFWSSTGSLRAEDQYSSTRYKETWAVFNQETQTWGKIQRITVTGGAADAKGMFDGIRYLRKLLSQKGVSVRVPTPILWKGNNFEYESVQGQSLWEVLMDSNLPVGQKFDLFSEYRRLLAAVSEPIESEDPNVPLGIADGYWEEDFQVEIGSLVVNPKTFGVGLIAYEGTNIFGFLEANRLFADEKFGLEPEQIPFHLSELNVFVSTDEEGKRSLVWDPYLNPEISKGSLEHLHFERDGRGRGMSDEWDGSKTDVDPDPDPDAYRGPF